MHNYTFGIFVILLFSFTQAIHIISSEDFSTVYSGPGGVAESGWDSKVAPHQFSKYSSVAQV